MPQQMREIDDESIAIVNVADMDKLREMQDECARIRERTNSKGNVTPVASIPWELHQRFFDLRGITFGQYMASQDLRREFLNSAEVQGFRLWKGRV
jgi:hypothetical protein